MSLQSMVMKLGLAFVAYKGYGAFKEGGGMDGLKRKLANEKQSGGGLGSMLGSLGLGGAAGAGSTGGIGGLLGGLTGAVGGAAGAQKMQGLLDSTAEKSVEPEAHAGLVIRAMVMAVKADGEIDETERRALWEIVGDSEPADRDFVQHALDAPVDVEALARDVPPGLENEVYAASLMAIDPDNQAEAQHLDKLAQRLNIAKGTVNDIHDAHGKPPLYTL